jgi:hypothetical protein
VNESKWAQDFAVPLRPPNELLAKDAQLLRSHEGLTRQLDAVFERQRELGVPAREEVA